MVFDLGVAAGDARHGLPPPFDSALPVTHVTLKVTGTVDGAAVNVDERYQLATELLVPELLFDQETKRIRSWDSIEHEAGVPVRRLRHQALDALRSALRSQSIDIMSFALFRANKIAGQAVAAAHIEINLDELLPPDPAQGGRMSVAIYAGAVLNAQVYNRTVQGTLFAAVVFDATLHAELEFSFDAPRLPDLDFRLPRIKIPKLDFSALQPDLDFLSKLLPARIPLPQLAIEMVWADPKPSCAVAFANGDLTLKVENGNGAIRMREPPKSDIATVSGFGLSIDAGAFRTVGTLASHAPPVPIADVVLDGKLTGPVTIRATGLTVMPSLQFTATPADPVVSGALIFEAKRVEIRAKEDPDVVLAFTATVELTYTADTPQDGKPEIKLTKLSLIDPYPIELIRKTLAAIGTGADKLYRLLQQIEMPPHPDILSPPKLPDPSALIERVERMLAAILKWIARQAGAGGRALADLGKAVADLMTKLIRAIRDTASDATHALSGLSIEIRLEARTYALRQIVVMPAYPSGGSLGTKPVDLSVLGLHLSVPTTYRPFIILDFRDHWGALALGSSTDNVSLWTDLWLDRAPSDGKAGVTEAAPDAKAADGDKPDAPLISVTSGLKASLALVAIEGGEAKFFRALREGAGGAATTAVSFDNGNESLTIGAVTQLEDFNFGNDLDAPKVSFNSDKAERLLPFLKKPSTSPGNAFTDKLSQFIKVKKVETSRPVTQDGVASVPLEVEVHLGDLVTQTTLELQFSLRTFKTRIEGEGTFTVSGPQTTLPFLGMEATIKPIDSSVAGTKPFPQFLLDLSTGDPRLSLAKGAQIELAFNKVSTTGRGIVFRSTDLLVSGDGIDFTATTDPNEPVTLAGVNTAFRFRAGTLAVKRSEIQSFSLQGSGQLPPDLIGEASADVHIMMGPDAAGRLSVSSAGGDIDKSEDPITCESTRFRFSLTHIGFEFVQSDGSYHFYFTLTGTAEFRPRPGEFDAGLLKFLSRTKIILHKVPLAGDPRVLARYIEFQVPVDPPVRASLFDIFSFELRGIGFHPSSAAFGGAPAMSISGQVNFAEFGDIPSPEFDFHEMWIAPPPPGGSLPRVRFDGLTVGLSLGSMARVRGTAIAVDDKLPSIYPPDVLPANVTAQGFLASGELAISGWADMSAAMGFLELRRADADIRHAFFLYAQLNRMSQPIPTPIGTFYLREAGFGFGFRYTLAGLQRADTVSKPAQLVALLDEVSKYQGDLANVKAWLPEPEGNRLTLALRALFTVNTASAPGTYDKAAEDPPEGGPANPVLFDFIAALRSDLTFLMSGRAWIAVNYADWLKGESWHDKPIMRGYLYISVPRKQFLARLIADPSGHIGEHPKLPAPLVLAMKSVRWSSTLYIDETMFHQEFGWPYELGFTLKDDEHDSFAVTVEGGNVLRITDGAVLYGIAFRARGFSRFSGQIGGSSLGASVEARADFALEAKFIAYLSVAHPSETFFYGAVQLDITISFSVRVWISFTIFRHEIRLEAGFSISLTISVGVELVVAARSPALGGRLHASISVGAFGRTLRLGVGLSFNDGLLDDTRARVARFMQLGLGAQYPDPEAGTPVPPPAPPRNQVQDKGDQIVDTAAQTNDALANPPRPAPAPGTPPDAIVGETLDNAAFWAMLFPTRVGSETWYLLQFVPRDHSAPGAEIPPSSATFYAPPDVAWRDLPASDDPTPRAWDHRLLFGDGWSLPAAAKLVVLTPDGKGSAAGFVGQTLPTHVVWDTVVAQGDDASLKLHRFMPACFLDPPPPAQAQFYTEPARQPLDGTQSLPSDPDEAAKMLAEASRHRSLLDPRGAREADIHERRSAVIATICESAVRIAAAGAPADPADGWPTAPKPGIDARQLGMTFAVNEAALDALFPTWRNQDQPPEGAFTIATAGHAGSDIVPVPAPTNCVRLFNPPDRFFAAAQPRLAGAVGSRADATITLDWDLEPTWGRSNSVYHDPEFHLKHYEIERRIIGLSARPRFQTVKAGAPIRYDAAHGKWVILRSKYQFVDDLTDLPEDFRRALQKKPPQGDGAAPVDPLTFWKQNRELQGLQSVQLSYTVVAVDIAGTRADPEVVVVEIKRPPDEAVPLRRASITFAYPRLPNLQDAKPVAPALELVVEDSEVDRLLNAKPADDLKRRRTRYTMRIATERAVGAGLFGIDAITEALGRPSVPAAGDRPRANEQDFTLIQDDASHDSVSITHRVADKTRPDGFKDLPPLNYRIDKAGLNGLAKYLGIDSDPEVKASRIYLRPQLNVNGSDIGKSRWIAADLVIRILSDKQPVVDAAVERFEHPLEVRFGALGFGDMKVEAGRLLVRYPHPDSTLDQMVHQPQAQVVLRRDGDRRVATRLFWNARPQQLRLADAFAGKKGLAALVGGFDVFSIDYDTMTRGMVDDAKANDAEVSRIARYAGRVQLLPRRLAGLEPSETGDFSKVEAFYPSDTIREGGTNGSAPPLSGRDHPFYSRAESLVVWPQRILRRMLLPNPPDEAIDVMFALGRPRTVRATLEGFPKLHAGTAITTCLVTQGVQSAPDAPLELPRPVAGWTVGELRRALQDMYWKPTGGDPDQLLRDSPAAFAGVKLTLEAFNADGISVGTTSIPLALAAKLHAILADVLELLRYAPGPRPYRRYEPVLENAPMPKATTVSGYIDETLPDRDPYGWGVLRTAGLALSLRLFDTADRTYLKAPAALDRINETLKIVSAVYAAAAPQATAALVPFVDLIARPNGLLDIASFDGGTPNAAGIGVGDDLLDNEALALTQVSLRPAADRLARAQPSVHYVLIRMKTSQAERIKAVQEAIATDAALDNLRKDASVKDEATAKARDDLATAPDDQAKVAALGNAEGQSAAAWDAVTKQEELIRIKFNVLTVKLQPSEHNVVFDVMDVTRSVTSPVVSVLASPSLLPAQQNDPSPLEETVAAEVKLDAGMVDRIVGVVRVMAWKKDGGGFSEDEAKLLIGIEIDSPHAVELELVAGPLFEAGAGTLDPFGRFGAMPARRLALLVHGWPDKDGKLLVRPSKACAAALANFLGYFSELEPTKLGDIVQQSEFWTRVASWTARFIDHGPAKPIAPPAPSALEPLIAFATITRPDPWRVAPGPDGRVEIMLVEKDRFGHVRRYAIRPFGRYDNFVEAVHGESGAKRSQPTLAGALLDDAGNFTANAFADAVLHRTEPMAPPVVLLARRVEDFLPDSESLKDIARADRLARQRQPGRVLELTIARHDEEVLSDANRLTEGALGFREIGVGFWRQFTYKAWGRVLEHSTDGEAIDYDEPFGPFKATGDLPPVLPTAPPLTVDSNALLPIQKLLPDIWRGAHALRLTTLPFGFRTHALAYAASGVVVSKPAGATLEETYYELHLPWAKSADEEAFDKAGTARHRRELSSAPTWGVTKAAGKLEVVVRLPLVRVIDCMDIDARNLWFGTGHEPDLFDVPDPGARYRVSIEASGRSVEPQLEILASPPDPLAPPPGSADAKQGHYIVQYVGSSLESPQHGPVVNRRGRVWELNVHASVKGVTKQELKGLNFGAMIAAALDSAAPSWPPRGAIASFRIHDTAISAWLKIHNGAAHALTITPYRNGSDAAGNPVYDWARLRASATAWRQEIEPYGAAATQALDDELAKILNVNTNADWQTIFHTAPDQPATVQVAKWLLGIPLSDAQPGLRLADSEVWTWHWSWADFKDTDRANREILEAAFDRAQWPGANPNLDMAALLRPRLRAHALQAKRNGELNPYDIPSWTMPVAPGIAPLFDKLADPLLPIPDCFMLTHTHVLSVQGTMTADERRDRLSAAFAALESLRGGAGAIEALGAIEDATPGQPLDIRVTLVLPARTSAAALTALAELGAIGSVVDGTAVVLTEPPGDDDFAALQSAAIQLPTDAVVYLRSAAQDQLLGAGRRLMLDLYRGLAVPAQAFIHRS
ncbi:hypothetical protein ACQR16_10055 [Bradyrhizobium oligotrophicum]|uniref:hypothetical protein n=1 Tax=Bradyrhizobium oligotrophicum TaxID=44255 RepID=UPI003EBDE250